jgi:hypothetical protein
MPSPIRPTASLHTKASALGGGLKSQPPRQTSSAVSPRSTTVTLPAPAAPGRTTATGGVNIHPQDPRTGSANLEVNTVNRNGQPVSQVRFQSTFEPDSRSSSAEASRTFHSTGANGRASTTTLGVQLGGGRSRDPLTNDQTRSSSRGASINHSGTFTGSRGGQHSYSVQGGITHNTSTTRLATGGSVRDQATGVNVGGEYSVTRQGHNGSASTLTVGGSLELNSSSSTVRLPGQPAVRTTGQSTSGSLRLDYSTSRTNARGTTRQSEVGIEGSFNHGSQRNPFGSSSTSGGSFRIHGGQTTLRPLGDGTSRMTRWSGSVGLETSSGTQRLQGQPTARTSSSTVRGEFGFSTGRVSADGTLLRGWSVTGSGNFSRSSTPGMGSSGSVGLSVTRQINPRLSVGVEAQHTFGQGVSGFSGQATLRFNP